MNVTKNARKRAASFVVAAAVLTMSASYSPTFADDAGVPVLGSYSAGNTHWREMDVVQFGEDTGGAADANIMIDPARKYQEYDGVGMSLEETSVSNLWKLSKATREETLRAVVEDWDVDLFRLVIGCCDCNERYPFWSLDDSPDNKDDFSFEHFTIAPDHEQHIIEAVQYILSLNPDVKFFASAWSAPAWMKEIRIMDGNNGFVRNEDGSYKVLLNDDGTPVRRYTGWVENNTYILPSGAENTRIEQMNYLRDDCVNAFAEYYLKYVQAYNALGIDIYAITILNEPGADVIYPAMNLTIEQHQLLAKAVKQKFAANDIDTQVWAHDWNINDWYSQKSDAGRTINDDTEDNHYKVFLDSPAAAGEDMLGTYDAVAVHPYDGGPDRISTQVTPYVGDMKVHQTETNEFGPATLINWFNNGASSYSAWVPFTDNAGGIHHWTSVKSNDYEPPAASGWRNRVATTRHDGNNDYVTFTNNFYGWGQFSKYLKSGSDRPGDEGAVRVFSTTGTQRNVTNTVFMNPDGEFVAVLNNSSSQARTVKITLLDKSFTQTLPGSSTVTLRWTPTLPAEGNNAAPVLLDVPNVEISQYETATLQLYGEDPDGDVFTYYGVGLPAGVTVDAKTGLVTFSSVPMGTYELTFAVSDGVAVSEASMTLTVKAKPFAINQRIEAEQYHEMSGWTVGTDFLENTSVASGGQNVGWTDTGKWLRFLVDVPQDGLYDVNFRVCNGNSTTSADCLSLQDAVGKALCTVSVPSTNASWTNYITVSSHVALSAGVQFVTLYCNTGGFNIDYFEILDGDVVVTDGASVAYANNGRTGVTDAVDVYVQTAPDTEYYYLFEDASSTVEVYYDGETGNPVGSYFNGSKEKGALVTVIGATPDKSLSQIVPSSGKITVPKPTESRPSVLKVVAYQGDLRVGAFTHTFAQPYIFTKQADGDAIVLSVENNSLQPKSGFLVLAAYDANGVLVFSDVRSFNAAAYGTASARFEPNVTARAYKAFNWDGGYVPLYNALAW